MSKITDKQKIDYLFKKKQNLGFTDLDTNNNFQPLFENRNYILGRDILSQDLPSVSDLNDNIAINDIKVKLISSNFYNTSLNTLKSDSSQILIKVEKLKLIKVPNTSNSWYCLDRDGNNFLTPVISSNYGVKDGTKMADYQIEIYSKKGLDRFSRGESYLANELLRTCDYIFDYNTGILLLTDNCKDNEGDLINNNNPPYITFFKYIGTTGAGSGSGSGTGLGGQWTKNDDDDIYFEDGDVLIGTTKKSPSLSEINLEVSGNVYISGNLEVSGNVIKRDELHVYGDISANTAEFDQVDICGNLNVAGLLDVKGKSIFQDVSLNKIGTATKDVSNIIIDGNIVPFNNEGYDLGSSTNSWRDLYLSNNSIIFKQEGSNNEDDIISIGIDTTDDDDGTTNYTLQLNIKGKDDEGVPAKKIKLGRGKVRQTEHNGVKTRKAEIILEDSSFNNVDVISDLSVDGNSVFQDVSGADASFNNINITGNIYKDGELFSSGSGIEISGNKIDVSLTSNESKIFYDASRNLFIGGVRQYADEPSRDTNPVIIEPLGYSFFRENMEGQPPAPSFFFFSITPSSIQINWTNPKQYVSGVSNTNDSYNDPANGEDAATVNSNGNIYFPVVNRIMIQIYNKETQSYETWGDKRSPITSNTASSGGVDGLKNGYVLCSKNYPIPPIKTGITPTFTGTTSISNGRVNKIYELNDFANSIILYSTGSTPENNNLSIDGNNEKRISGNKSDANSTELANSNSGYEIKLWLENQYDSGSMTESDFNVVTLDDTGDGVTPINFTEAEAPSTDATLNAIIKFNDLPSATNGVKDGKTYVELQIKDPSRAANDKPDLNSSINLTGIEFEIAYYDNNEAPQFNLVSDFYFKDTTTIITNSDLPSTSLLDGFHQINRLRDNSIRYYYVPLDNTKSKKNIQFRIYYKNATNPNFRLQSETSTIVVNKPNKPIISQIKMSSSDQLEISIAGMTPNNKISNTSNTSVNNNNGVFLRTIDLIAKYKSDNDNIEEYTPQITTQGVDDRNYYHNNTQDTTTTYIFDLPSGEDVSALSSLKWAFQIRVKNNLINEWSVISETAISNNNIDKTKNNAIEIIGVSTSNQVTDFKFVQSERTNISNAEMDLRWENPAAGDRGVGTSNLNNVTNKIPTIYDYQYSVFRPDVSEDNRIIIDASNIQIDRNTDAYNQGTNLPFIFDIFDKNGNKNNSSGSGNTGGNEREIKTIISQRNEYVTNQTQITGSLYYILSPPGLVNITNNTPTPYVTPDINDINYLKLLWDKPNETGLQIRELADKTLKDYVQIPLGIKQYDIDITAKRTTSKSPYYYLQGNDTAATNDVSISGIQINFTRDDYGGFIDASGSLSGNNGIINKDTVKWSGSTGDTIANLLVFPDTKYIFNIKTTNVFNLQGNAKKIETDTYSPDSLLKQFNTTDKKIPIHSTYGNINIDDNSNLFYGEKGFLLETNVDTKPTTITLYEITKARNFPSFSASDTHRINKNKFNDFLVDNDTDKIPNEYVKSTSQLDDKKLRQFRIKNNANLIYTIGSDSSFNIKNDSTSGTALENMLAITSTDVSDEFADGSGKDTNNRGYWWKENIKYTITINSTKNTLYKNPIKLTFEARYNNQLSSNTSWSSSSLVDVNDVDVVQKDIFQNTNNPSDHIYFDKLNNIPIAIKNGNTDMINYTTDNKINGIPNLYIISSSYSYQFSLNYKLTNFSEYYGLDNTKNFLEHTLKSNTGSNVSISEIQPRSWNSKDNCVRTPSEWTITNLIINNGSATNISNVNLGSSSETGSDADVRLVLNLVNTFGDNNFSINSNHSSVFRFIYDKNSVDEFTSVESSLQNIPSNFDPTYGSTSAQSPFTNSSYSAKGDTVNNKQLSLWNGYFYGSDGWQNATSITTSNCTNYGMSNDLPVFTGQDSDYKWVIFKYQGSGNSTSAYTYYTVIVKFSDSDFDYDNNIVDEDIVVYFYNRGQTTQGNDGNNYYWLNISGKSDYGGTDASTGAINTYSGTVGISTQNSNSSNFENSTYSKLGTTGARIIGGWLNSSSIPANTQADFYLAVGIKNTTTYGNNDVKIKKPEITLAKASQVRKILT